MKGNEKIDDIFSLFSMQPFEVRSTMAFDGKSIEFHFIYCSKFDAYEV